MELNSEKLQNALKVWLMQCTYDAKNENGISEQNAQKVAAVLKILPQIVKIIIEIIEIFIKKNKENVQDTKTT